MLLLLGTFCESIAGFNPRWYEVCEFKVRVPELAIVRFAVMDDDTGFDDFIGYYTLPFNTMQEGTRVVILQVLLHMLLHVSAFKYRVGG